jgi:hypothetical protein
MSRNEGTRSVSEFMTILGFEVSFVARRKSR